jgi:S1-C subfamily serine protease
MPEVFCVQLTAAGEIEFVRGRAVSHEGLLVCDFRSEQGQSGSPVFDADGQLLGIIAGKFRGYPLVVQSIQILKQVQRIRDAQPELDRRNAEFFRAK